MNADGKKMHVPRLTLADLRAARAAFEEREPRDVFYRAAIELVGLALKKRIRLTVADALAVLLQTWNKNFYRFGRTFDGNHFAEIEGLLHRHKKQLTAFRLRNIESLEAADEDDVLEVFQEFESVLGPVGAAKALHLLAPRFFPIWDREVARRLRVSLGRTGTNERRYWTLMLIAKSQCLDLRQQGGEHNLLKAIDEYNYCKFTLGIL
jgi:hypothetical protein